MDFEKTKKVRILTLIEIVIFLAFLIFTSVQAYKYVTARNEEEKPYKEAVAKQLEKAEASDAAQSDKEEVEPQNLTYEGLHPYGLVDLPYDLASLTIQNKDGSAVYTNGKAAGVNLPVKEVRDERTDSLTAVDLSMLDPDTLSFSGTGANPTLNIRYSDGYTVKVVLGHAFQVSATKDGDISVLNLQKGDTFDITYSFNMDSYKYPGTSKFVLGGTASDNGAMMLQVRGDILTVSGLPFEKAMLSVDQNVTGGGYGVPAESETGFYTYNFKTKEGSNTGVKKGI
jgi:hypothetical protein